MVEQIEAIDISTLPEEEKARIYKEFNDLLKSGESDYDQLEPYYNARYPGLIKERIQKLYRKNKPFEIAPADDIKADDADDDVDELVHELMNKDWLPKTKEEWAQFHRDDEEWDDEERQTHLLYDPGSREKILYPDCIQKYGRPITVRMYQADQCTAGKLDVETWQQIQDIHKKNKGPNGTKPRRDVDIVIAPKQQVVENIVVDVKAIVQCERRKGDDYFLKLERGVIRNKSYRLVFKKIGRSVLYEYLWANIVREGWIDKPGYPIKESYYNKGYLAYCSSLRELGLACGLDKNTVKISLDEFAEAGIIKLEQIIPQGKAYSQTVAILGEWRAIEQGGSVKISERYYRDEVFLAPPADVPFQFKK